MSYEYYHARMAGRDVEHPDAPQPGRYRLPARRTAQTGNVNAAPPKSHAVAIYPDPGDGKLRVLIGPRRVLVEGEDAYLAFADQGWARCVPIAEELYLSVLNGGSFPDEHEAVTLSNMAPPDDSFEALSEAIADLAREAEALIKAGAAQSQEASDRAADLANRIGELQKKANELRRAEKKPHEDAAREIDKLWNPIIAAAEVYKRLKNVVCLPWLAEQNRKADEAKFQAQLSGTREQDLPRARATAGSRGRPVAAREQKFAVITDYPTLLAALAKHEKVQEVVQDLANASARNGITLPGMRIDKRDVAA